MLTLSLNERLLSVLLNQNSPCIILQPVFPENRDLSRFRSNIGTLPVAVFEGNIGCRYHLPASVVVSGGATIVATVARVSDVFAVWTGFDVEV